MRKNKDTSFPADTLVAGQSHQLASKEDRIPQLEAWVWKSLQVLLPNPSLYRWGNWGTQRLHNSHKLPNSLVGVQCGLCPEAQGRALKPSPPQPHLPAGTGEARVHPWDFPVKLRNTGYFHLVFCYKMMLRKPLPPQIISLGWKMTQKLSIQWLISPLKSSKYILMPLNRNYSALAEGKRKSVWISWWICQKRQGWDAPMSFKLWFDFLWDDYTEFLPSLHKGSF